MAEYPKREQFFAHKAMRLMIRTCLMNEIGHAAFSLLSVIALTEDCARYRRPVTWYDEQLIPVAGFKTYKTLKTARDKAVKSGWLHYEHGAKSVPGRYWIIIPAHAQNIEDTEMGFVREHFPPADQDNFPCPTGKGNGNHNGSETVSTTEDEWEGERKRNGIALIPNPNPVPDPNPHEGESAEISQMQNLIDSLANRLTMPCGESGEFKVWYAEFPNPGKRGRAWMAYQNAVISIMRRAVDDSQILVETEAHAILLDGVRRYAASPVGSTGPPDGAVTDWRVEPHSWLDGQCWMDPPLKLQVGGNLEKNKPRTDSSELDAFLDSHGP